MQIVVEISEQDYMLAWEYPDALINKYAYAIKYGTPLPKGHGDLIDIKDLEYEIESVEGYSEYDYEYVAREDIELAPVIIKADKGGGE